MDIMKITKELKDLIEKNQNQLKAGIRNHQRLLAVLESDPENIAVQKQLQTEQEHIIVIGLEQKVILDKLRKEYKVFRKQTKINGTKNSIDDKRFNLTVALHHAKKQNISVPNPLVTPYSSSSARPRHHRNQTTSPPTPPEDQFDSNNSDIAPIAASNHNAYVASGQSPTHSSPEPPPLYSGSVEEELEPDGKRPLFPQDIGQVEFLQYLHLATHEVFKEMQSKRVERKRRSTANPQFLYTRGWDISKRKRNFYLSNLTASPPTTRQSVQRGKVAKLVVQQPQVPSVDHAHPRISPPRQGNLLATGLESRSGSASPTDVAGAPTSFGGTMSVALPGITYLPSGLTIEPIREEQTVCIDCKQPGNNLSICEECSHGFHIACHNRPLVSTPRHCPVCYTDAKEARLRQQQMVRQSTSPITIIPPPTTHQQQQQLLLIEEKLELKNNLLTRNKLLTAQLTELQDQHSKLTISLRTQQQQREDLISDQDCTKDKIHTILRFISKMKGAEITEENTSAEVETTGNLEVVFDESPKNSKQEEIKSENEEETCPESAENSPFEVDNQCHRSKLEKASCIREKNEKSDEIVDDLDENEEDMVKDANNLLALAEFDAGN